MTKVSVCSVSLQYSLGQTYSSLFVIADVIMWSPDDESDLG